MNPFHPVWPSIICLVCLFASEHLGLPLPQPQTNLAQQTGEPELPFTAIPQPPTEQPTTLILIRHAEREGSQDALSAAGRERAQLVRQMGLALNVSVIYTTNTQRARDTIAPLAEHLQLAPLVYEYFPDKDHSEWLQELQNQHAGQTILVVGHSNTTGKLAGQLGRFAGRDLEHNEYSTMFLVKLKPGQAPDHAEFKFEK